MSAHADHAPLRGGEPAEILASDGFRLRGEWLLPAGRPRAAVALSHAMMVDRRTLDRPRGAGLLSALVQAGAAVLWFDQRGHGQSAVAPGREASWSYDDLVADVGPVARALAARFPELPRVAVGHSLFGHAALAHQGRAAAEGAQPDALFHRLVLVASGIWLPDLEPRRGRWLLKRALVRLLSTPLRRLGRLPTRALRLGTDDEPLPFLQQMADWVLLGEWIDRTGRSYRADLPAVSIPILTVAGAGDWLLAHPDNVRNLVRQTSGPVWNRIVGRAEGHALDPGHMAMVLDRRLAAVWQELSAWTVEGPRGEYPP